MTALTLLQAAAITGRFKVTAKKGIANHLKTQWCKRTTIFCAHKSCERFGLDSAGWVFWTEQDRAFFSGQEAIVAMSLVPCAIFVERAAYTSPFSHPEPDYFFM